LKHRRAPYALTVPLALAALGVAPSVASVSGSGLSITPPVAEHAATVGVVGSVTVTNASSQALRVGVAAHPWLQSTSGLAVPDQRRALPNVRLSDTAFALASGASKVVSISLLRIPAGGSLYGNVDVTGIPTQKTNAPGAINFEYRLIQSLRLNPSHSVVAARAGRVVVTGTHRNGEISLAVKNTGNTIAPIGGTVHIKGARGAVSGSVAPVRVLPGMTVNLPMLAVHGSLAAGSYSLSASLNASGRHLLNAKGKFKLR